METYVSLDNAVAARGLIGYFDDTWFYHIWWMSISTNVSERLSIVLLMSFDPYFVS